MLIYSPDWLFLVPGLVLCLAGFVAGNFTYWTHAKIGGVVFDVGTLVVACMWLIIGLQFVMLAFFTKTFAIAEGLLPEDPKFSRLFKYFTLEKGIACGLVMLLFGGTLLVRAIWLWHSAGFGLMDYSSNLRRLIPAATLIALGVQTISGSFFMSVLGLKTAFRNPPSLPIETTATPTPR
jgi:hypothetical protein